MKILVIAPTPFFSNRGTHIRILEEALALENLGHNITIATYHIGSNISEKIQTSIDLRRINRLLFWYKKLEAGPDWQKLILDFMLLRKVFYLARKQKPEIIHGHLHEGVLIGWLVQKMLFWRKIKLVADFHGSLTNEMVSHSYLKNGFLNKFFSWVEKQVDNLGDSAITSSKENAEKIKTLRKDKQVEIVLDGVNLKYHEDLPSKIDSKKNLELPLDKIIISYTGALVSNKGTTYLFEAIKNILTLNDKLFFILAGFPVEGARNFIQKNSLEKNVRLISPLNYFELPEILNASDAGIDPKDSFSGQASGKILQYMGAGLPVICFDRQNNHEYLGKGAFYAKEISAQSLENAIIFAINNPNEMKNKGDFNQKKAADFSWNNSAKKINQIYKNITK